jgi:L-amino acid N-acyltransferase YncA
MVKIRPATLDDMPIITEIYGGAVREGTASFELYPPDLAEMVARREALLADNFPYLVAEHEGHVVGYCYAGHYRPRPAYRYTVEDSIYISPRMHGRGVGRMLLARLIAECEVRGFRQMVAIIGDSANLGSIKLHKALGFAQIGTLKDVGFKHGRWLDQVNMQRALGDGAKSKPE